MVGTAGRRLLIIGVPILILLVLVFAVSQCGGSTLGSQQGGPGNALAAGIAEEPDTLDPQKTNTAVTAILLRYAGDTLITKDLDGNYVAALAKSWEESEDGLTWTFQLKDGVKFHNGDPVDAEAVKASIERAMDPDTKAGVAGSLFSQVEEIRTPSENTVEIRLKQPFSVFEANIADPRAAIVDVEAAEKMGDEFGRTPVLTGPWKVVEWKSGDRIRMERNPDYSWGPGFAHDGPPHIEELTFRIMTDNATRIAALQSGEIQMTEVPPVNVEQLRGSGDYQLYDYLRNGVGLFMEFNVNKEPFDDPVVREAMNYTIDKEPIVQAALRGLGQPACGPLPPSIEDFWQGVCEYAPSYDPEKAKSLLFKAGYEPGPDGTLRKDGKPFEFTLFIMPEDNWKQSAQLVQQQLKDIGINMEIQSFEFGTLLEKAKAGEQQAHLMGYTYTNPDILYLWFHSSNIGEGLNLSHVDDPKLDAMLEKSRTTIEEDAQKEVYRDIQRYVVDKSLWVPLWNNQEHIATRQVLKGADISPEGYLFLLDAQLTEE
jgi:peptide/nickel transport system substrate-binding protein